PATATQAAAPAPAKDAADKPPTVMVPVAPLD
ncbi:MAG: hypothetical protein QOC56_2662, partial [Alphaproteobacteria bacterium]|nr:hypothetical protein [Alphaproteobacteria bacterium]